ncbi:tyrosine-type recombinase/integrase [Runella slithyformis]|uniref:Tyrosine recombinase XerC n=1 Tax=Runella slithyformis (strain ATCC 29530 / DSM 19594 / LMG 11500 / NCIMB 11436 / LSU 4) TaxID=761193 RepID=A0A7U3ZK55_RUNSL|nr:tyrosine-type recombinase/integrase [Runella slithyformis]AEI48638.1 Tyrosine recombinase xerC [Runella slithyformis DSM 19594]
MLEQFLQHLRVEKRLSDHTLTAYKKDLEQFSEFLEKTYNLTALPQADFRMIRGWAVSLVEAELHHRSVNRKLATLRSFYGYLLRCKVISINPTQRVSALKTDKPLPQFVEEKSLLVLFNDMEFGADFEGVRDRLILELLYGTGMRLAELLELKDPDINYYDLTLKVLGKRNKQRVIPIYKSLADLIKKYQILKNEHFPGANILILTNKGEPAYPVLIQRIVKKYLSAVTSLQKRSPHVLRHTFATHLLNNGADLNSIKDLLGHSSLAATQVYTHNSIEKLKKIFKQSHPKA